MHPTLRVALHFKRTVITALSLAVAVGFFLGWLVFRTPALAPYSANTGTTPQSPNLSANTDATPPLLRFCYGYPKIPYVPADKCGGISSCDRARLNGGNPVVCPR
jgi:hypothetical protein